MIEADARGLRKKTDRIIGAIIRERRRKLDLGQRELGDKLGVTREAVTGWESGRISVYAGDLPRLADALEVPLPYLYGPDYFGYQLRILSNDFPRRVTVTEASKESGTSDVGPNEELLQFYAALPDKLKEAVVSHTRSLFEFWISLDMNTAHGDGEKPGHDHPPDSEVNALAKPDV